MKHEKNNKKRHGRAEKNVDYRNLVLKYPCSAIFILKTDNFFSKIKKHTRKFIIQPQTSCVTNLTKKFLSSSLIDVFDVWLSSFSQFSLSPLFLSAPISSSNVSIVVKCELDARLSIVAFVPYK